MKKIIVIFIILIACNVSAKDTIYWLEPTYEPFWIETGDMKDKGFEQVKRKWLEQKLPEYNHQRIVCNFPRLQKYLLKKKGKKNGVYAWTTVSIEPQYLKGALHTVESAKIPDYEIATLNKNLSRFKNGQSVSLHKDILPDMSLRMGIEAGTCANTGITDDECKQKNVYEVSKTNQEAFYKMMIKGRIDYYLTTAFNFKYCMDKLGIADKFVLIPYQEASAFLKAYGYAGDTPKGKELIEKLNKIFRTQEYYEIQRESHRPFLTKDKFKLIDAANRKLILGD